MGEEELPYVFTTSQALLDALTDVRIKADTAEKEAEEAFTNSKGHTEPVKLYDHAMDAMRYALSRLMTKVKAGITTIEEEQRTEPLTEAEMIDMDDMWTLGD